MAKMMDAEPTEYQGERATYNAIKENLPDDVICYFNREVDGLEFDFCLLIKNLGLVIIEVKGWQSKDVIKVENPNKIILSLYDQPQKSPKQQARSYRFALRNLFQKNYGLSLPITNLVCYPFMSEIEYTHNGLRVVSEPELTLFAEDLASKSRMSKKIVSAFNSNVLLHTDTVAGHNYDMIRSHFETEVKPLEAELRSYSMLRIFPEGICLSDMDLILKEYGLGTKQFIFVPDEASLDLLAGNLNSVLDSKRIFFDGTSFNGYADSKNTLSPKNGRLSCFVFEAYAVRGLQGICPTRKDIENGQIGGGDDTILQELSKASSFNFDQYQVEHADPTKHIQITAGAGTGKTYSMISRISFLVNHASKSGIYDPASEIAMLTFTVDAATNMKTRIKAQFLNYFCLTKDKKYLHLVAGIERMRISTIHSFAKEIIQNTSIPIGIGSDFSTVNGVYEKRRFLQRNLNAYLSEKRSENPNLFYSLPIDPYELEKTIENFTDRLYNKGCDVRNIDIAALGHPNSGFDFFNDFFERVIRKTEIEYSDYLLENNAVSLAHYMIHLNRCIAHESFNSSNWPFKVVFIDEFQDVDDSQIQAFHAMQEKLHFRFFIVGDLKQSIYRFRGATLDAFSAMVGSGDGWNFFSLTNNYRSDKALLEKFDLVFQDLASKKFLPYGAQDVLVGVKGSVDPDYQPTRKIEIVEGELGTDEASRFDLLFEAANKRCDEINDTLKKRKLSPAEKTVAILVRTNAQIGQVLFEAKKRNIVVLSDTNISLYKLQPALDLCKLTNALCNPYDPVSLFDLIVSNNIHCTFPVGCLSGLPNDGKVKLLTECLDQCLNATMGCGWVELIKKAKSEPVLKVLHEIYEATRPWLYYSKDAEKQIYYRTNYELLFEDLTRTNKKSYLTLDAVNESLTVAITTGLQANSREIVDDFEAARIVCVTIHGSKGLEYDTVILPFANDQIDKLKRNAIEVTYVDGKVGYYVELNRDAILQNEYFITQNEIQEIAMEESRILYVALTRAINHFIWMREERNADKLTWSSFLKELEDVD